jgi:protein-disulfide isomerase
MPRPIDDHRPCRPPGTDPHPAWDMTAPGRRVALLGALLGAFASAYLLVDYLFGSGICLTGSGCDVVRTSSFAYPLGIPMPLVGLGFYAVAVGLLLANPARTLRGLRISRLALGWAAAGLAVMTSLTLVEIFVIGALCSWCLLSALGSLLLTIGALGASRSQLTAPPDSPRSSRARRRQEGDREQAERSVRGFASTTGFVLGIALVALLALPALTSGAPAKVESSGSTDRPHTGRGSVEVVVFSDFQCPACAAAARVLSQLADDDAITLVYRYFPLTGIHANAMSAAEAAQAAALQGRFWEFHDQLFAQQAGWAELSPPDAAAAFEGIATEIGLDLPRWRSDVESSAVAQAVSSDAHEAQDLQLRGTPTIFIDGQQYTGPLTFASLSQAVAGAAAPGH